MKEALFCRGLVYGWGGFANRCNASSLICLEHTGVIYLIAQVPFGGNR